MFKLTKSWTSRGNWARRDISVTPDVRERYGPLFDIGYYLRQAPEVTASDAVEHYETEGCRQGLSPHPLFCDTHYRSQLGSEPVENAVLHFRRLGWRNGTSPHPLFDTSFYLSLIEEQLDNGGSLDEMNPLEHYLTEGWFAGLSPHRLVNLDYASVFVSKLKRSQAEPLTYLLRLGLEKNCRPHPLYYPPNLSTCLNSRGERIDHRSLLACYASWSEAYSLSPLLDLDFYANEYPETTEFAGGPQAHFLNIGQFEDFDPNPYFSSSYYRDRYRSALRGMSPFMHYLTHELSLRYDPSPLFSARHYSRRNPLVRKSRLSLLEHFLSLGRFRSCEIQPFRVPEFLKDQLRAARTLEPEINVKERDLNRLAVINRHQSVKAASLFKVLRQLIGDPFKVLVLVPFLSRGGADLSACNLIKWLQQSHGSDNVLLLLTDSSLAKSADWLPAGTRRVCLSHLDPNVKPKERESLVQLLIEEYRPETCYNVNSKAGWDLMAEKGKGISKFTKLHANLFCYDFDNNMQPVGYAVEHLPKSLPHLSKVYFDNDAFRHQIRSTLTTSEADQDKLTTLYQPAKSFGVRQPLESVLARVGRSHHKRRQVMWAGRLDRQKRPDILAKIARHCPEFDFHVFGSEVMDKNGGQLEFSTNVKRHGEYAEFFDLPLDVMDAFLVYVGLGWNAFDPDRRRPGGSPDRGTQRRWNFGTRRQLDGLAGRGL